MIQGIKIFINTLLGSVGLHLTKIRQPVINPYLVHMWEGDSAFLTLYNAVKHFTATPLDGAYFLYQLAIKATYLPGDYAEIGVYKGGMAKIISRASNFKPLHLYDTFNGMPKPNETIDWHEEGMYADTSIELVKSNLSDCDNVVFHQGYFPNSAIGEDAVKFSFIYIDADLYTSVLNACEFFYPKMVTGGLIIFDDYYTCPGVRKAIKEYFADKPDKPLYIPTTSGHILVIKS